MKLKQLFLFVLFINSCYGFMNSKIHLKSISNKNNNFNKIIKSEQFDLLLKNILFIYHFGIYI